MLLGGSRVRVPEDGRRNADMLWILYSDRCYRTVPEQMRVDRPTKGPLGGPHDGLVDILLSYGVTVLGNPEPVAVVPLQELWANRCEIVLKIGDEITRDRDLDPGESLLGLAGGVSGLRRSA